MATNLWLNLSGGRNDHSEIADLRGGKLLATINVTRSLPRFYESRKHRRWSHTTVYSL
jgi:hypothetical protein